jgi:hypothetical protein
LISLLVFFFFTGAFAQRSIQDLPNDILDIISQTHDLESQKQAGLLEDTLHSGQQCSTIDETDQCAEFAESLLPQGKKEKGWRTVFEIKYRPMDLRGESLRTPSRMRIERGLNAINQYYQNTERENLESQEAIMIEAEKIQTWAASRDPILSLEDTRAALMISELQKSKSYNEMMAHLRSLSSTMSDDDYLHFLSGVAGWVDYNDARAGFVQNEGAGLGRIGPFELLKATSTGICGDIHSMVAKLAEQRGWEAYTVGYAVTGSQHVVTAISNPSNPNSLMIVNYGRFEENALNDGNSIRATPSSQGWSDVGMQMRIFKNTASGGADGAMQQIATIPNALGSFMLDLFQRQNQISKTMPQNENYRKTSTELGTTSRSTKLNSDGSRLTEKEVANGIIIYEGETDNASLFGVAVNREVYKTLYRYDPATGKCVPKKNKYFAIGLAASQIQLPLEGLNNTFYAYLNMKGGQIFHIYETDNFKFKGLLGYEFEAFGATENDGSFLSADGQLSTFMGLITDYNNKGTSIKTTLKWEGNVAMKDQNLMTDFSTLPRNINPVALNAASLQVNTSHRVSPQTTLLTDNKIIMSRVGSRLLLSTGVLQNNSSVMLSYQGGMKPIQISGVNFLQNLNGPDGLRLSVGHHFSNRQGTLSGNVSGWGGMSVETPQRQYFGGATLKMNLNKTRRRPSSGP